jgi:hypothetical protein
MFAEFETNLVVIFIHVSLILLFTISFNSQNILISEKNQAVLMDGSIKGSRYQQERKRSHYKTNVSKLPTDSPQNSSILVRRLIEK